MYREIKHLYICTLLRLLLRHLPLTLALAHLSE